MSPLLCSSNRTTTKYLYNNNIYSLICKYISKSHLIVTSISLFFAQQHKFTRKKYHIIIFFFYKYKKCTHIVTLEEIKNPLFSELKSVNVESLIEY